jgi:hypothetical protein
MFAGLHHRSRDNFRFSQCVSLRDVSNTGSTWRLSARIMSMRACEHCRPAVCGDQYQRFHRRLALRGRVFGLRQLGDVGAGVLQCDEPDAVRQRDRTLNDRFQPVAAIRKKSAPVCRFKIVVSAQGGWIWGAVPCDDEPSFLDTDAHVLDCGPTMPQFYPLQVQQSRPRRARKEKLIAE